MMMMLTSATTRCVCPPLVPSSRSTFALSPSLPSFHSPISPFLPSDTRCRCSLLTHSWLPLRVDRHGAVRRFSCTSYAQEDILRWWRRVNCSAIARSWNVCSHPLLFLLFSSPFFLPSPSPLLPYLPPSLPPFPSFFPSSLLLVTNA